MHKPIAKRIAILMPDLRCGGAERVALNLANEYCARGFFVDMVVLNTVKDFFLLDLHPSVRIVDLQAKRLRNSFLPLLKYLKSEKPDSMIANMWPLTGIAVIAKYLSKSALKLIVVEHINWAMSGTNYSVFYKFLMKYGMHWLFPKADAIVAVSDGASDALSILCRIPRTNITTIYNPIVADNVQPSGYLEMPSSWHDGNHKKVIAVGMLKTQKNYPLLLEAFSILTRKINARLLILGEGDLRAELESQVESLGLGDAVLLLGAVKNPLSYLQRADLFVLSSNFEGFGNVLVEALQAGVPIVSTDCPSGPREILCSGRYGALVPVGDAVCLAKAMLDSLSVIHDTHLLIERSQDFSIVNIADEYLMLLFPASDV